MGTEHISRYAGNFVGIANIGNVRTSRTSRSKNLRLFGASRISVDVNEFDVGSVLRKQARDRSADSASTACHDRDPTIEESIPVFDWRRRRTFFRCHVAIFPRPNDLRFPLGRSRPTNRRRATSTPRIRGRIDGCER
jgi:hypothetical protein